MDGRINEIGLKNSKTKYIHVILKSETGMSSIMKFVSMIQYACENID